MIPVTQIYTINEKCISHQGTNIFAGKIMNPGTEDLLQVSN